MNTEYITVKLLKVINMFCPLEDIKEQVIGKVAAVFIMNEYGSY